jgi:hypothetical protein
VIRFFSLENSSREVEGTAHGYLGNHDHVSQVLTPADPRHEGVLEDEVKLPGGIRRLSKMRGISFINLGYPPGSMEG